MRILGIDPGLCNTGWGIIEKKGYKASWVAHGVIKPDTKAELPNRLSHLYLEMKTIIETYEPNAICIEEIFMNTNPQSTLKLGMARGVLMMLGGLFNLHVSEFRPNHIKKTVTGSGHADKGQIMRMMQILLNPKDPISSDAADALAVAFCYIT